jgi:hypothetical protein
MLHAVRKLLHTRRNLECLYVQQCQFFAPRLTVAVPTGYCCCHMAGGVAAHRSARTQQSSLEKKQDCNTATLPH